MNRKTLYGLIGGFVFCVIGIVLGFLIGTSIGGNYFPTFQLLDWTGYEATGWLGIIFGGMLGIIGGSFLGRKFASKSA